jgi:hypothetical protein
MHFYIMHPLPTFDGTGGVSHAFFRQPGRIVETEGPRSATSSCFDRSLRYRRIREDAVL